MERTRAVIVPVTIQICYERLMRMIAELGWHTIEADHKTFTLRWRKGDTWWTRRRHFLTIALNERGNNQTEVRIIIKDPVIAWGGSNLIERDMQQMVEHIKAGLASLHQQAVNA